MLRSSGRLLRTVPVTNRHPLLARSVASVMARSAFVTTPTEKDPYQYQVGFGNRFESEAIPGVLPNGQIMPQKNKYDLYTEGELRL
ncbi:hypothetical protein BN14_05824 [Rhizoctonia solani AG-1 IB]|uniref:Homogentisate 1,2-dioxygenase N-terminal domain-containing protein n=1 Tax=Thanatephorus cucumeris (strain AG1-IB / isolate 7/3/14) TaxID=1108050 RepID=M5BWV1_THACB|nr:hypothetical protein BN14_05824 [Rhizoctonia solani AG-1 IB]